MVFIYTVCENIAQAKELGRKIIKARVAACVNIWPIESIYFWEGKLTEGQEAVLLIKTNEQKFADIESFLKKYHTYSTPIIASINADRLNREYKEWMSTRITK
ncbi:hypothetical protein A3A09_01700 [Candidatus Nomurabacteria bacterium RIFCSPLOWO2_01_FULL_42_20]|uniref:Cation tolerance protein CutA n=1 Tax=Candidatus Nomurabacteria bacterium RIFCSPHIGHO2_01_FULL_42_16 TaxID=1801743 RepID=A0A1F6VL22_9BACT|nr:MAG: hypothetical protein A2824_01230 [Candidatus Nomurabacteria bacterium RIFCSPHIGHO2_01_FULL_42_16]OGI91255.1 MAG: hypothetical protein A3A09_01700 [Candidatus Nomurabacteria bacterium RIFCSPLOWO2_01_FULL_42_20]